MAKLDLVEIIDSVAAVIRESVPANFTVHAGYPDVAIVPPAVMVYPAEEFVSYHLAFQGGAGDVRLEVRVITAASASGARDLLRYLGAGVGSKSIIDAIEADRSLRGSVADCVVERARWLDRQLLGDGQNQSPVWGAVLDVTVYLSPRKDVA